MTVTEMDLLDLTIDERVGMIEKAHFVEMKECLKKSDRLLKSLDDDVRQMVEKVFQERDDADVEAYRWIYKVAFMDGLCLAHRAFK